MRSFLANPKIILFVLSLATLLVALVAGTWLAALGALAALLVALGRMTEELPLRMPVLLAVTGASIGGALLMTPVYENSFDRRWINMRQALMQIDPGGVAYPIRPARPGEDELQLLRKAQELVREAMNDCSHARDRSVSNAAQDFARSAYIPQEASVVTDRFNTKVDPDLCLKTSAKIIDLVPSFKPIFDDAARVSGRK